MKKKGRLTDMVVIHTITGKADETNNMKNHITGTGLNVTTGVPAHKIGCIIGNFFENIASITNLCGANFFKTHLSIYLQSYKVNGRYKGMRREGGCRSLAFADSVSKIEAT
jgi:hypothetical protein